MTACFIKQAPMVVTGNSADSLLVEAKGLALLRDTLIQADINEICIPEVFSVDESQLKLEIIECSRSTPELMARLGIGLAKLHKIYHVDYGLPYDNFIGLNRQKNTVSRDWGRFFVDHRLRFQVSLISNQTIRARFLSVLDAMEDNLVMYLNEHTEYASLVHGDLWSGNALFDKGSCWLIDPAVYYADREVDLAMTEMFGGFTDAFYQAYDAHLPRSPAYPLKRTIYNLYHYLNHYNLFGSGYLQACEQGFDRLMNVFSD